MIATGSVPFQRLSPRTSLLRTNPHPHPAAPGGPDCRAEDRRETRTRAERPGAKEGRGGVVLAVRAAVTVTGVGH